MAEPFLSEIRIFSFNFPPKGWAFCNGQFMPINQNQALFALLGTTYGGNGQTTFALPNLQGRAQIHFGSGHNLGEQGGSSAVTVNIQQLPTHTHIVTATKNETSQTPVPSAALLSPGNNLYTGQVNLTTMSPESVSSVGGNQPHTNMMPYLVLNFCIALQGIFPS